MNQRACSRLARYKPHAQETGIAGCRVDGVPDGFFGDRRLRGLEGPDAAPEHAPYLETDEDACPLFQFLREVFRLHRERFPLADVEFDGVFRELDEGVHPISRCTT